MTPIELFLDGVSSWNQEAISLLVSLQISQLSTA